MNSFVKRLKSQGNTKQWKQEDVAKQLGIPGFTYSKFETGAQEPTVSMLRKIVNLFEVDANYLLGWTKVPQENSTMNKC
jgi:transcriptional regulator with XRE-family HTH domain